MILSHPTPRMTAEGLARVKYALRGPDNTCSDYSGPWACKSTKATLTRRLINYAVTIHIQCDQCGRSLGGSLSRKEHFAWQDYAEWDDARSKHWNETVQKRLEAAQRQSQRERDQAENHRREYYRQRSREYREWCRTSPEWARVCDLVMWRSRKTCEACLRNPAETVHHLTYENGLLPPAWGLRAVCHACHDKLHDGENEWCVSGMAR